jgi:hypothetical protein
MGQQLRGGTALNQVKALPFAILLVLMLVIGIEVFCDQELSSTSTITNGMKFAIHRMLFRRCSGIRAR